MRGVHVGPPHWPDTPPPPHVWPFWQLPHWSSPPHPSAIAPHETPLAAHVVGVQFGVTHWFCEQSWFDAHGLPQSRTLPHPSDAGPHWRFMLAHVFGEQLAAPHTFAEPPPPHACPFGQSPQWILPPQPSG